MSTEGAFQPSLFDDLTPDDADTGATGPVVPLAGPGGSTAGSDRSSSEPLVLPAGGEPAHVGGVRVGGWAAQSPAPTPPDDHGVGVGGPSDRAFHLARVCASFPTTISGRSVLRLVRLLDVHGDGPPVSPDIG